MGGGLLRVVGIDNSTGLVEPAQLSFFNQQAASAAAARQPLVLAVHFPLHSIALAAELEQAGCPGMGAELCGAGASDADTAAFLAAAGECAGLVAVLAGHVRCATAAPFGAHSCVQYTVDAGCFGGYRLCDFSAASPPAAL